MAKSKRLYVIDTNVLMHDPTSIFRFEEHDVFLPMMVLEELDAAKKGLTEVSRNVRQVSRFIGEMMEIQGVAQLEKRTRPVNPTGTGITQCAWPPLLPDPYNRNPSDPVKKGLICR